MMEETNPETPEVEAAPEMDAEVETHETEAEDGDQIEYDEDGNPIEPEPPELVEVEYNGKKYRIDPALKDGVLMQSDYTRKTQELAEQRKAFEAQREQYQQLSDEEFKARADIYTIDQAINDYKQVDWDTWERTDPQAAQKAWRAYERLKDQRSEAEQRFQKAAQGRTLQEQRESAERLQQGLATLQKEIPGWGQEKAQALIDFGEKQLGFSRQELNMIDDPRMIIALNYAFEGVGKRKAAQATAKASSHVKPAAKVTGGRTPGNKLDDRVSTEAWMKRRMAEVTKR